MRLFYLVFLLVFSLIVLNIIPAYAVDTFDNSLDGWSYSGTSGYSLSNNNNMAHISGNGISVTPNAGKTFDVTNADSTILSFDWRTSSNYAGSSTTNFKLTILDTQGNTLSSQTLQAGGTTDTGIQSYSEDISNIISEHDSIVIRMSLSDYWGANWNQKIWWDNVDLQVTTLQQDTTPPVITLTGDNPQSIELGNSYTELGATTDDGSTVTIDSSAFSDSLGSYSVTYNSVDSSGNDAIQVTRTVTVVDTTPPTITAPSNITAEATGTSTSVTIISATATDESSFTITNNAPVSFPYGVTTITWTATDHSGNQSTITSTVTIQDTTPPVITLTGDNPQSIELGNGYAELGATTNDGSPITIDSSAFSNSLGSYTISYNSVDSSGNTAVTVTRTVNVVDTTPPVITAPDNITAEATGTSTSVTLVSATATDNRDSSPTITNNAPASFPYGVTTITWTATDHSGNQSTVTSTVTISDPRKPTQGETPLNELDKWIIDHGGIYFGMGIFTFGFIIIGVMASPKTVPIFTIILVILAGLLHATGIFILPAWFWGIAIIMTITLVLKRKK